VGSDPARHTWTSFAAGKTRTEALRLLRRRLSDAVFAAQLADEKTRCGKPDDPSKPHLAAAA